MEEQDYATTYRLEGGNWWFVGMRRICMEWVGRCQPRGRILDVGCGTGINLDALEVFGPATGADLSSTALDFCRQRALPSLVQARGEGLPFPDGSFDVVTAFGVIEHIDADRDTVAEWTRLAAPGGHVVLLTSAYQWMWSGHDVSNHHVRRYRASEVRALLEDAGLVDVRVSYLNTFLGVPIIAARLVERVLLRGREPKARKDTGEVPPAIDRLLTAILGLEGRILRTRNLPFGVSIAASGRRPG